MSESGSGRQLLDTEVVARLRHFPLLARQPMVGSVSGRHRSPHRGSSLEFAEYRKYVPGDDTRRLDWRAFGRSDRYYIKEFEADTNLRLQLVVDCSGSMAFESGETTRLDYARRMAATLGYMALEQGDAVGLTCVGGKSASMIPPRRNPAHLAVVLDRLVAAEPAGEGELCAALHELAETVRQRALVVILSDLFVDPQSLAKAWQHLRFCKHDVAVFHLLDKQEIEFVFDRPLRFVDLEGGAPVVTQPDMIAGQYRAAMTAYLDKILEAAREAGADYRRTMLDEPYESALAQFLLRRAQ